MGTPIPLDEPRLQAFIDPVRGTVYWTGAVNVDRNRIVGFNTDLGITGASHFKFSDGSFVNRQDFSGLGIAPSSVQGNFILAQDGQHIFCDKDGESNSVGFAKIDPTVSPWQVVATYGYGSSDDEWPANTVFFESMIEANGQIVTGSQLGGWISEPPLSRIQQSVVAMVLLSRGRFDENGATVWYIGQPHSAFGTKYRLGYVDLPGFGNTVIKDYLPTDFDAAWSSFSHFSGPAFDQTDGNLIVYVATTDSVTHQHYIAKLNKTSGAVMWTCPVGPGATNLDLSIPFARIRKGVFMLFESVLLGPNIMHAIDTSTGADTQINVTGTISADYQMSDDAIGGVIGFLVASVDPDFAELLNGTPASFTSMGVLYAIEPGGSSGGPQGTGGGFYAEVI